MIIIVCTKIRALIQRQNIFQTYMSTNTRPDITFAVSQVARFNHSPKKSHVTAIKMLIHYLKCIINKGTIIRPTGTLQLDCWVDATFRNLYHVDPDHEPSTAKSCTGYIITLGGCPLVWKSQLQSTIALSTQEGEYCTLSQAMHTLIPIHAILIEISSTLSLPPSTTASIHSRVFEDNNGTLLLAVNQCIISCTKHYLIQWHFFWSHVEDGEVEVLRVDTDLQDADYMTKGLPCQPFERNCFHTQGW